MMIAWQSTGIAAAGRQGQAHPRITRRRVVAGAPLASGLAAAFLAACGPLRTAGPRRVRGSALTSQPATIEWYKFLNAPEAAKAEEFLAEFHGSQTQTMVKLINRSGAQAVYLPQLLAMVAAGQPPDVIQIQQSAYACVVLGIVQDISDLLRRDRVAVQKFDQLLFQHSSQWEGKTYGLPYATQSGGWGLIYNRNLLRAAGVAEPPEIWNDPAWTWPKLTETLQKVARKGLDGTTAVHGINSVGHWEWAPQSMWGGAWLEEDQQTIVCDKPEVLDCYQSLVDLRLKHRVWPQAGENPDFRRQATAFSSITAFDVLAYANLPQDLDWALAPYPRGTPKAKTSPQAYVFDHKIAKGSSELRREHAWVFMQWLTAMSRAAIFEGRPPALKEDWPRWTASVLQGRPNVRPSVLTEAKPLRPELAWLHPKWSSDMRPLLVAEFWNPVFAGEKPVNITLLREMKRRLETIIAG